MVSENVKKIIDYLYHQHGNRCDSGKIVSQLQLSNEDFERIVYAPSIHKNLISWKSLALNGLLGFVRLTDVGIRYIENGYKFDHEINNNSSLVNNGIIIQGENNSSILGDHNKIDINKEKNKNHRVEIIIGVVVVIIGAFCLKLLGLDG